MRSVNGTKTISSFVFSEVKENPNSAISEKSKLQQTAKPYLNFFIFIYYIPQQNKLMITSMEKYDKMLGNSLNQSHGQYI